MIRASYVCAVAALVLLGFGAPLPAAAEDAASPAPMSPAAPSAAAPEKSELGNSCALGLSEGKVVDTDCSVNWTGPDGKLYCFSSDNSKNIFLKNAEANLKKARDFKLAQAQAPAPASASLTAGADLTEDDVKAAVMKTIEERSKDGAFVYYDPKIPADLNLVFEQINIMRRMEDYGWFATVMFHDKDEPKKQFELDFWYKRKAPPTLMDIRVRRAAVQKGDTYELVTRQPVAWWWLPASDHPGDIETVRAWQVMSAIHNYIATHKDKDGNISIKDDKTGEDVPLQFIEMHKTVRRLKKDGKFFICTDFRKPGTQDQYYDIDFWVDQKSSGKLEVGDVKIHKVPVEEDGMVHQESRYNFDDKDSEATR
jgi:hypothetical protein